jgi:hypothetical protein
MVFAVSTDTFGLETHRETVTRLDACRWDMVSRKTVIIVVGINGLSLSCLTKHGLIH